ncbi:hypothetical protein WN943_022271 [Citrus x changshan-huyou]
MIHISDIKLIRTDTTLDLSQKAEKVSHRSSSSLSIIVISLLRTPVQRHLLSRQLTTRCSLQSVKLPSAPSLTETHNTLQPAIRQASHAIAVTSIAELLSRTQGA